jgi:hypothetical protein
MKDGDSVIVMDGYLVINTIYIKHCSLIIPLSTADFYSG